MEKDHLEILVEEMNGKCDRVLDGLRLLSGQVESSREEAREAAGRRACKVDVIIQKLDKLDQRLALLEQRFDGFGGRVGEGGKS